MEEKLKSMSKQKIVLRGELFDVKIFFFLVNL